MTTSQITTLREPSGPERVPATTLNYMRTRNRRRLYTLIVREFKKSGLTQADLARRLGKNKADVICRWLAHPTNIRADTLSDLLFAISGAEAAYKPHYPLQDSKLNSGFPDWLPDTPVELAIGDRATKKVNPSSSNTGAKIELLPASA